MNPLFLPELLYCILDCLLPSKGHPTREERRTLAALARTCSALSEASLDRLWHSLESLQPLIRSFSGVVDKAKVKIPPSPQEWLVIDRYAFRIQELTLGTDRSSLHFLRSSNLNLSNLKVLKWERMSLSHLQPSLTPQIITLEMTLASPVGAKFQLFFEERFLLWPHLKSIKVDFYSKRDRISWNATPPLLHAICSRADWRHVDLTCAIDNVTLRHLALSSSLKVVSLSLAPGTTQDDTCFGHEEIPFRDVKNLAFTVWNHLGCVAHLLRPRDQAFHTFGVTLKDTAQATAMDISALLTKVVSPPRIQSLQSLSFTRPCRSPGPLIFASELSYKTLLPITSLVHLRELFIDLDNPITLNDAEFANLVCNWPCLEEMWLMGGCNEYPAATLITLQGLLLLLASCPELYKIGLSLDARQVPSADDARALGVSLDMCRPRVTSLTVQDSRIERPELVDAFVKNICQMYTGWVWCLRRGLSPRVGRTKRCGEW